MWWLKSQWFVEKCGSGMNVYFQCEKSGRMCSCVQIFWAESSIFHSKYSFSTVHQMAKLVRYEHFSKTKLLLNNAIIITIHHFHMSMTLTTVYQNYAHPFYSNIELQKIPHTLLMSWHRVAYYFAPIRTKHNAMQKNMTAVGAVAIMARAQIKSKWKRNINNSKCFFCGFHSMPYKKIHNFIINIIISHFCCCCCLCLTCVLCIICSRVVSCGFHFSKARFLSCCLWLH